MTEDKRPQEPAGDTGRSIRKYIKVTLTINLGLFFLFNMGERITVWQFTGDGIFDLSPKGWGYPLELIIAVLGVSVFTIFYTLPSFMVRPWIGFCLKALFNGGFGLFLLFVSANRSIGVQERRDHFVFVRTWPFPSTVLTRHEIEDVRFRNTGFVSAIGIKHSSAMELSIRPVYNVDRVGIATLMNLKESLLKRPKEADSGD